MALAWSLFLAYVVVTLALAWVGKRKTDSLESYALGSRRMSPWVVGIALAASMTSTATLVINPGIVYAYGLSAFLGYGVAAASGLSIGIVLLSKGFRRFGVSQRILTVPDWIGRRYGDRRLTVLFALINLLLLAMVVMICYAMAGLMLATLDLPSLVGGAAFEVALAVIVLFVFAYVFFGGTYAHAYTNTVQGVIMLVVAVVLIGSGIRGVLDGSLLEGLRQIDPVLAAPVNPTSLLFRNLFEVFGANFVVGFALAVQPHFIVKSLYVERDRDVHVYLAVAIVVGIVFTLVMLCGLYARVGAAEAVAEFTGRTGLGVDGVMPAYIVHTFSGAVQIMISIALLAAGMSTLDGILVALSAIFANDVYRNVRRRREGEQEDAAMAFRVGRWSLLVFGVVAFVLAVVQHRVKEFSIAIFAQEGVYALFAATFVPVLFGMFGRTLPKAWLVVSSVGALAVHFTFRYARLTLATEADWTNPGLTATWGLLFAVAVGVAGLALAGRRAA